MGDGEEKELQSRLVLFERLRTPIWVYDPRRARVLWANEAGLRVWEAPSLCDLRSRDLADMQSAALERSLCQLLDDPEAPTESVEVWAPVGGTFEARPMFTRNSPIVLSSGRKVLLVEGLLDPRVALETRRAADVASPVAPRIDGLTRLLNRHGFMRAAQRLLTKQSRCALFYIDLDGLKTVNDALGHAQGDHLIQQVALRLEAFANPGSALGRLGGDEFTMLTPTDATAEELQRQAEDIVTSLAAPYDLGDDRIRAGASVGVCVYPDDADGLEGLINRADFAMSRAKERGRGSATLFSPAGYAEMKTASELTSALRGALLRNELSLVFQPIVDDRNRGIRKVECLLRWTSRDFGPVPPARFIPIAEESGLIRGVGSWVLREACERAQRWRENGLEDVTVSVNVSGHQFLQRSFLDDVALALRTSGLPPANLEMELTETVLVSQLDNAIAVLEELARMGIGLTIDDFGTGYSSLAYLHTLPVGSLKVDRSFVARLPRHTARSIVKATVSLARGLGLAVVAEGVETEDQRDELRSLGVDLMQGYLFARPMPEGGLLEWWKPRLEVVSGST